MTAREKFKKGDRVRISQEAAAALGRRRTTPLTGVVIGFGRRDRLVRVLRDGLRTPESWDMEHWTVLPAGGDR